MKNLYRTFIMGNLILLPVIFSCSPTITRVNPSPKPIPSEIPVTKVTFPPESSFESFSPPPEPERIEVEKFTFEVNVSFEGSKLGRVWLQNNSGYSELKETPAKFVVNGGVYGIFVFDLVGRNCQAKKVFFLDKNMSFNFKRDEECPR